MAIKDKKSMEVTLWAAANKLRGGVRCNCCEAFYSPEFEIQFIVFDINGNRKIYES